MSNWQLEISTLGATGLGCSLVLLALLVTPALRAEESSLSQPTAAGHRLREGTTLSEQVGRFELQGERVVFCIEGSEQRYCCLENLSLARVYKAVTETPDELQWVVSGTLTEYQHLNYLLITHAVRQPQPPAFRPHTQARHRSPRR